MSDFEVSNEGSVFWTGWELPDSRSCWGSALGALLQPQSPPYL